MTKDAKAAEKQRLAAALRANLRRRKAAQDTRAERQTEADDGAHQTRTEKAK